ncbi:MAG TPA: FecR domain-containing protein [Ohtaekwangia sp.]|nr:FecR domain-containing protein [Ohtaekwangia sp.]
MKNELENIDDLIGKYLAGEASEHERDTVSLWVRQSDENERYFNQLRTIFDKAAAVKDVPEFDVDAAWNKVRADLKGRSASIRPERTTSVNFWFRAAAIAIIVSGIGWYLLSGDTTTYAAREVVADTSTLNDTLPNGANVFLNKQTHLAYEFDKKSKTHEVKLKGEAYFDINKTRKEEFIVDAGDVFIQDIGTSFNVRAYPESDEVEVLVEEGEVRFFSANNPGITLKAGGKGVYNRKEDTFSVDEPEANITAYKTRSFVFAGTDLKTVAETVNYVYAKQFVVPAHLETCTITVSFRDEPIEEIAAIIAETLALQYTDDGNEIVFSGDGCR